MLNMKLGNQLRMAAEDYKQMFAISLLNFTCLLPVTSFVKWDWSFPWDIMECYQKYKLNKSMNINPQQYITTTNKISFIKLSFNFNPFLNSLKKLTGLTVALLYRACANTAPHVQLSISSPVSKENRQL